MPRANHDSLLPPALQISDNRHSTPRHRPPTDTHLQNLHVIPQQPLRRLVEHRNTLPINDTLIRNLGERIRTAV